MNPLMMMTSDIALKVDPTIAASARSSGRFRCLHPGVLEGMVKLTTTVRERYLGPEKRNEDDLLWQDPIPPLDHRPITDGDVAVLKRAIMYGRVPVRSELVAFSRRVDLSRQRQAW
jgi:catalase-peroxidase